MNKAQGISQDTLPNGCVWYCTLSTVAEIPLRRIKAAVTKYAYATQSKSHGRTHLTLATILGIVKIDSEYKYGTAVRLSIVWISNRML
jgi:hypothetical protein